MEEKLALCIGVDIRKALQYRYRYCKGIMGIDLDNNDNLIFAVAPTKIDLRKNINLMLIIL